LQPVHVIAILNAVMIDKVVQRVMLKDEANKVFYGKCYQDELKHDRDALNRLDTAAGERGIEQGRQEGLQEAINLYDFIHNALRERAAQLGFPFIWKYPETLSGV